MRLFHYLVLNVTVKLSIRNLVLDSNNAEVVEYDVFNVHRNFYFAALCLCESPSICKIIVIVDGGVSATLLLVQDHLLSDDLVLVGDLVKFDHEIL